MNEFLFRGHFLIARSSASIAVPDGWASVTTRDWTCVYREGTVVHALVRGSAERPDLLMIGFMIDPSAPEKTDDDILDGVGEAQTDPLSIADQLRGLSGRFVLFVDGPDGAFVFHDACGLRPVYYGDTKSGLTITSDPAVHVHFGEVELRYRPGFWGSQHQTSDMEWWIPSGISLVEGIDQLTPNHYLRCSTGEPVRYYPDRRIRVTASMPDVVAAAAATLRSSIDAAARRWPLVLPLTAGVDSRTVLAASRRQMSRIRVYTFRSWPGLRSPDERVARQLTRIIGVPHRVLPRDKKPGLAFAEAFVQSTVNPHFDRRASLIWAESRITPGSVILNGNVVEVARCHYYKSGTHDPITAPDQILSRIKGWPAIGFVSEAVASWFASANNAAETSGIDILDLFYWEHRMGSWSAQSFMESTPACELFTPFNNRALLELLLTVPTTWRSKPDYALFHQLWREMWPELARPPVNPEPRVPLRSRARTFRRGARDIVRRALATTHLLPVARAARRRIRGPR